MTDCTNGSSTRKTESGAAPACTAVCNRATGKPSRLWAITRISARTGCPQWLIISPAPWRCSRSWARIEAATLPAQGSSGQAVAPAASSINPASARIIRHLAVCHEVVMLNIAVVWKISCQCSQERCDARNMTTAGWCPTGRAGAGPTRYRPGPVCRAPTHRRGRRRSAAGYVLAPAIRCRVASASARRSAPWLGRSGRKRISASMHGSPSNRHRWGTNASSPTKGTRAWLSAACG